MGKEASKYDSEIFFDQWKEPLSCSEVNGTNESWQEWGHNINNAIKCWKMLSIRVPKGSSKATRQSWAAEVSERVETCIKGWRRCQADCQANASRGYFACKIGHKCCGVWTFEAAELLLLQFLELSFYADQTFFIGSADAFFAALFPFHCVLLMPSTRLVWLSLATCQL